MGIISSQFKKCIVRCVTPKNIVFLLKQSADIKDNKIYLNSLYAKVLDLSDGDRVHLELVKSSINLAEMTLTCANDDQYAIAKLNKDLIERTFMDQVEVVSAEAPVLFWVSKSTNIQFIISDIKPLSALLISKYTEVRLESTTTVNNTSQERTHNYTSTSYTSHETIHNSGSLAKIRFNENNKPETVPCISMNCFCPKRKPYYSFKLILNIGNLNQENIIFPIEDCSICNQLQDSKKNCVITVDRILGSQFHENELVIIKSIPYDVKTSVMISEISLNVDIPVFNEILKDFSVFVHARSLLWKVIITQNKNITKVKSVEKIQDLNFNIPVCKTSSHSLIFESIIDRILHSYTFQTKSLTLITSNTSCHGAGKTCLMRALQYHPQLSNFFVLYTDTTKLRGRRVDNIIKELSELLDLCYLNQPSILLVDNLDVVLPPCSKNDESSGDELFGTRLAHSIIHLFEAYKKSNIEILFSCQKKSSCHPVILESCDKILTLPLLNSNQQFNFLLSLLHDTIKKDKLYDLFSMLSLRSNLSPGEIVKISKILHMYISNSRNSDTKEISQVCKLFELEKKKLPTDGIKLKDCGGLFEVKAEINKILVLPFQYPELFSQIPFQLNRGLLLFGPPGVGKTHILKALSSEINMNFISVKGPELLNKYIGASEEGVRNLFSKAQELSPTLIFFDEFDSLAPLRGEDTTGVMDRVVNQLLTELDGVSRHNNIFVIAATSRPDVIDPAVLRPGRIGRNIFCPMPGPSERHEVWECLLRTVKHDQSVKISILSEKSQYFSGADIKAVIYNAQLAAVKRAAGNLTSSTSIFLSQDDLLTSLNSTSPSLSISDMKNYEEVYDIFLSGRKVNIGKRTTQK